jgi:predicted 3-demethylubiquinone-9 3-methyltransferase (glyoxalase superfamily)
MQKIATFLMFEGQAEEAMSFYLSLFPDSKLKSIARYGEGETGRAGSVQHATFSVNDQLFMCIDSPVKHQFTFTPSMSLHVTCSSEQEINQLFASLSVGAQILMPLDSYPFAKKYTWLNDRFGVSWQLALTEA